MVTINLTPDKERRLRELAASRQIGLPELIDRAIDEYLSVEGWGEDSADDWARASVALTPDVLTDEPWDEGDKPDGPG